MKSRALLLSSFSVFLANAALAESPPCEDIELSVGITPPLDCVSVELETRCQIGGTVVNECAETLWLSDEWPDSETCLDGCLQNEIQADRQRGLRFDFYEEGVNEWNLGFTHDGIEHVLSVSAIVTSPTYDSSGDSDDGCAASSPMGTGLLAVFLCPILIVCRMRA